MVHNLMAHASTIKLNPNFYAVSCFAGKIKLCFPNMSNRKSLTNINNFDYYCSLPERYTFSWYVIMLQHEQKIFRTKSSIQLCKYTMIQHIFLYCTNCKVVRPSSGFIFPKKKKKEKTQNKQQSMNKRNSSKHIFRRPNVTASSLNRFEQKLFFAHLQYDFLLSR